MALSSAVPRVTMQNPLSFIRSENWMHSDLFREERKLTWDGGTIWSSLFDLYLRLREHCTDLRVKLRFRLVLFAACTSSSQGCEEFLSWNRLSWLNLRQSDVCCGSQVWSLPQANVSKCLCLAWLVIRGLRPGA
jgi:hypothetical protein